MNESQKTVFMIGIAGSGMRGLAYLLQQQGNIIIGVDDQHENIRESPEFSAYILPPPSSASKSLTRADVVIFSDAVKPDHPLLKKAKELNIASQPYQEALGSFAKKFATIAVTGTHGKSSTTAFLAHIAVEAGLDPSVLIGASVPAWDNRNARSGKSNLFIVEADEFREHFLTLFPEHTIITTIDFDHPDYYRDIREVEKAYEQFMQQTSQEGSITVLDSVYQEHQSIAWPGNCTVINKKEAEEISLAIPGKHMRENALLAVAVAETLNIKKELAIGYLKTFKGISRRFEQIGSLGEMKIVSDYGHHPEEIAATIKGAKELPETSKLLVLLEPHTLERLTAFGNDFAESLSLADAVIICPVFLPKGREGESTKQEVAALVDSLEKQKTPVQVITDFSELKSVLEKESSRFTTCIAFSAGVLDSILRKLLS